MFAFLVNLLYRGVSSGDRAVQIQFEIFECVEGFCARGSGNN